VIRLIDLGVEFNIFSHLQKKTKVPKKNVLAKINFHWHSFPQEVVNEIVIMS